jgi:hypothetical protein
MVKSAIERLVDVHPDLEVWLDSSPLVMCVALIDLQQS